MFKLLPWFLPLSSVHRRVLNSEVQPFLRQLSVPSAEQAPSASALVYVMLLERVLPCSDYTLLKREADKRVWAVRHSPKRFHALLGSYLNNRLGCALPLNEIQAYQCSLHHATTSSTHHDAGSPQPVSAILSVAFSCSLSSPFSLRRLAIFLFISVIISL